MVRALLLLSPWLFVGGCTSFVTGMARVPGTVTIGYELLFQELWDPVIGAGLLTMLACLPLMIWAGLSTLPATREVLARTLTAPGPLLLLATVIVLLTISSNAHSEAVTRSDEAQAVFMADLHDYAPPSLTSVRYHQDWRQTAHLSRTLYLAAACCFAVWLGLRAWLVARAKPGRTGRAPG